MTLTFATLLLPAMASLPYNVVSANAAVAIFAAFFGWSTGFATAVDNNNYNTKNLRGLIANDEDVYRLAPRDILDAQLDAFSIEPILEQPGRRKKGIPAELSSNPMDDSWVFEGYLHRPPKEKSTALDGKRKSMREYFARLNDSERVGLEERLETRRIVRARQSAITRGVAFDERKEVAIALLENNEVWSLRVPSNVTSKSLHAARKGFVGNATLVDYDGDDPKHHQRSDSGIGLDLVSGYNGFNMRSYPWRTIGCLSTSTSSSGCMCSGTKISARLVLTAGHCFAEEGTATWDPNIVFWISGADGVDKMINGRDDTPNGVRGYSTRVLPPQWFYYENTLHDYGLFVLTSEKSNCDLGWLGYANELSLLNTNVNVYGYPVHSCEASPVSSGLCTNSIYGETEKVKSETSMTFQYDIDTQGGMSGSGVYWKRDDVRTVVGVHVRGGELDGDATRINGDVSSFIQSTLEKYPDSSAC
jgi:V8-like Glu-specific endopeptidase